MSEAYICHFESASQFYIQQVKDEDTLHEIEQRLATGVFEEAGILEIDMKCIAKFSADNAWYRAQVVSINEGVTIVQFMDYGNSAEASEFRKLPEDLLCVDAVAKQCTLASKPVSEEEEHKFLSAAKNHSVILKFLQLDCQQTPLQVIRIKNLPLSSPAHKVASMNESSKSSTMFDYMIQNENKIKNAIDIDWDKGKNIGVGLTVLHFPIYAFVISNVF
jgi:hypothetical protein